MIVRNEALTIPRCFASMKGLIDKVYLIDTGSEDDTIDVAEAEAAKNGFEFWDDYEDWVDFGHNRSSLMRLAKGKADWLLLIDADMTVSFDPVAVASLEEDTYATSYMISYSGNLAYRQKLLVSGRESWRYVGKTHEYIEMTSGVDVCVDFDGLQITHHGDGGSRSDKYARDMELLAAEIREDPKNPRSWFYLAQTQEGLGKTEQAAGSYARRSLLGGWWEERWVAQFRAAKLLNDVEELLIAYDSNPDRAGEVFYELARIARLEKHYSLAKVFATVGIEAGPPTRSTLFIDTGAYSWGLLFELAISKWYLNEQAEAGEMFRSLLSMQLPPGIRAAVEKNLTFCEPPAVIG